MSQAAVILPGSPLSGAGAASAINSALAATISCFSGTSAPTLGPGVAGALVVGQSWLDTTSAPNVLSVYDGASWCPWMRLDTSAHVVSMALGGYLRVGSVSAPSNTTAGDLTANRISIGNLTLAATTPNVINAAFTATSGNNYALYTFATVSPGGASTANYYGGLFRSSWDASQNIAGSYAAKYSAYLYGVGSGTATRTVGMLAYGLDAQGSTTSWGTITDAIGIQVYGADSSASTTGTGTITRVTGVVIQNAGKGTNVTYTGTAGIAIANQTQGTNNTNLLIGTTTIPSGSWSIYNSSTNANYIAGSLGIGTTSNLDYTRLRIAASMTGAVTAYLVQAIGSVQSDVTAGAYYFQSYAGTAAASFTLANLYHFGTGQGTFGAGSTVTNQYAFYVNASLTGATNNYGFYGNIAAGTGRYNLYMAGTAANYLAGITTVANATASTSTTTGALIVTGGVGIGGAVYAGGLIAATGAISSASSIKSTSTSGGIGYGTGAGGTVTQDTSKSTGVTLDKVCGQITMNNAALGAATTVSFTLTDAAIAAGDVLVVNHISGGTAGSYTVNAQSAAGSAVISVRNVSAGSLSEAIVLAFAVIKAVTS